MSESKISQKDVEEILRLVQSAEHIVDFRFKYGDLEINLSRVDGSPRGGGPGGAIAAAPPAAPESPQAQTASVKASTSAGAATTRAGKKSNEVPEGMTAVKAPMVGTFYCAASPGATPFVKVGAKVDADTVVGIIEVMKLMNSLPAGVSGTVREILVSDSQPVGFGELLILIEPNA